MAGKINFEDNINELENIVGQLEKNDISLDESLKLFERGVKLSAQCNKLLDEAEQKVNVLVKKDGALTAEKFTLGDDE